MIGKIWRWLNREDERERYPDGRLVIRGPWVAGAVERLLDALPLWLQRIGGLVLQMLAGCLVAFLVARFAGWV